MLIPNVHAGGLVHVNLLCGWGVWDEHDNPVPAETRRLIAESASHREDNPAAYRGYFPSLEISGDAAPAGPQTMLWELARQVLGADVPNTPQAVGDCFPAGTMVRMADGSEKPIESVKIGDRVISHLGNAKLVTNTIRKPYSGDLVTIKAKDYERSVTATPDHRFVSPNVGQGREPDFAWTEIGNLTEENRVLLSIMTKIGLAAKIAHIDRRRVDDIQVYCLEVEDDHSFVANGYCTSNCISWGAKHAVEFTQVSLMAAGNRLLFKQVFSPYLWGMGRLAPDCGNNRLRRQDGSVGIWQAKAVVEYGSITVDATLPNGTVVPAYSGTVARQWGNLPGPSADWVALGKEHVIQSYAPVLTWEDLQKAIHNNFAVTVASDVGYDMTPRSDGFNHNSTSWSHQMCIVGIDDGDDKIEPHACIMNSWGDVHGKITDFRTGHAWPVGTLRVRKADILKMLGQQDSFAYSGYAGFPAPPIPRPNTDPW